MFSTEVLKHFVSRAPGGDRRRQPSRECEGLRSRCGEVRTEGQRADVLHGGLQRGRTGWDDPDHNCVKSLSSYFCWYVRFDKQLKSNFFYDCITCRWRQHWDQVCSRCGRACRGWHRLWHHQKRQRHVHSEVHASRSRAVHHHGAVRWSGENSDRGTASGNEFCQNEMFNKPNVFNVGTGNPHQPLQNKGGSFPRCS